MKGIILCSGGLDTTLATIMLIKEGHYVIPLHITYNQWQHREELESIHKVVNWVRNKYPNGIAPLEVLKVDFPLKVGHSTYRPAAFMGLAGMVSELHKEWEVEFISTGYLGETEYIEGLSQSQDQIRFLCELYGLKYINPLYGWTKPKVGVALKEEGVPWEIMYTCFWAPSCQSRSEKDTYLCRGCRQKVEAMKAAGAPEELLRRPNVPQ